MSTRISDLLRPDQRLLVRPSDTWTAEAAADAVELANDRRVPAVTHVDEEATADREALTAAGFAESRRDANVVIPVEPALDALHAAELPDGLQVRSAADVEEDRLRLLDNELRQDVPGSSGWQSTPEEFREQSFDDPEFDPRTYLVAVDEESGEYVGLVRIWMKPDRPRLGFVGVRRDRRRQGIASALLAHALRAVHSTGAAEVTMEHDLRNDASRTLAERLGARRLGTTIELVYEPEPAREVSGVR
jgi:RimJ/RimL family protein N-acetyltransferase